MGNGSFLFYKKSPKLIIWFTKQVYHKSMERSDPYQAMAFSYGTARGALYVRKIRKRSIKPLFYVHVLDFYDSFSHSPSLVFVDSGPGAPYLELLSHLFQKYLQAETGERDLFKGQQALDQLASVAKEQASGSQDPPLFSVFALQGGIASTQGEGKN